MLKRWLLALIIFSMTLCMGKYGLAGESLRIGYLQNDIHQLACWVAIEKGFYKKNGLAVKVAGIFKAGPEEMSAFAAGALDMGYVGEAPATTAVANKMAKVKVVAQVNTEGSAIVIGRDSPISTMSGLRGRRVAVPGYSTVQDFLLRKAMAKWGLKQNEIKVTVLKPPEMIGALRTQQIDGFIAWEPYPAKACTVGVGKVLLYSRDIWKNHPCCVLIAANSFLKKRKMEAVALVKAHVEATNFINHNPEEAVQIGAKYTGMDEETIRLALRNVDYTYRLNTIGEVEYVRFLASLKYIKVKDPNGFVEKFIDKTILKEALRR